MNGLRNAAAALIENRTFDEIMVGDSASLTRQLAREDIELFAVASGDVNPAHLDPAYAETDLFHKVIAHGMWSGALISAVLGTRLPGPGTIYLSQDLHFRAPVGIGDTITATVTAREKRPQHGPRIVFDCRCVNQDGKEVVSGIAEVQAPTETVRRPRVELPEVRLTRHQRFRDLLAHATADRPVPMAVAHPCDAVAVAAVVEAAAAGLITPILVGPEAKIRAAAEAAGADISGFRLVPTPHSHAAAAQAVALVRAGEAEMLMKGSLHTDELLHEVVQAETGLRTGRRLSHVYVMDVPAYPRPLLVTDAAVNIAPRLEEKRDIVQNAIDLAKVMGIAEPRVAILSAVETVNPAIPSTLEAAALCKMAERGQITGGIVDGPLAFDNAVSPEAARQKGITSPVAGLADILVVPDLEAGNMLAKQLTFLAGADAAGVVLGARVPIVLTSRADAQRTRIASCAVAVLMARARLAAPNLGS
ncbi:bifunctional enoyl-CoA hydratase/phosphate acetyltransferase [Belnapia sp. T6]|uniref:Bifunctional enoyl-CoA hydratase/phosphate acetyltransferase n=1 Tax=Belnapia mucosa TaxID=2804532 RepID=A0ABS1V3T2_9PROT|nr:bifunctional enoyl-CoA hydratase/phosphate acetyltransferase [Belnapia mucosa]MBL6456335.1 bifunctional enoyl-CoA hydratase/phosphate acetyltransferase [Belnapia mucosa]